MTDANVTVQGRATAAPELRYTQNGKPVANLTVAHTERRLNRSSGEWEDVGETLFLRVTIWGDQATFVTDSVRKGDAIVVIGRLTQRSYETAAGEKRTAIECTADVVSIDLRRARAVVTRVTSTPADAAPGDSWAAPTSAAAAA